MKQACQDNHLGPVTMIENHRAALLSSDAFKGARGPCLCFMAHAKEDRRKIAGLYDNSMFNLLWNCSPLFIDFQTHEAGKNLKSDLEQCSSDLWISHISKITITIALSPKSSRACHQNEGQLCKMNIFSVR